MGLKAYLIYQLRYTLQGLEGAEVYIDDILIHGPTQEVHDARLRAMFQRLKNFGFRLQTTKTILGKRFPCSAT